MVELLEVPRMLRNAGNARRPYGRNDATGGQYLFLFKGGIGRYETVCLYSA